jgi:hypothetical protein
MPGVGEGVAAAATELAGDPLVLAAPEHPVSIRSTETIPEAVER